MRRIEWVADHAALGCVHFVVTRLISRLDELEAITVSSGSAASISANNSIFRSSRSARSPGRTLHR